MYAHSVVPLQWARVERAVAAWLAKFQESSLHCLANDGTEVPSLMPMTDTQKVYSAQVRRFAVWLSLTHHVSVFEATREMCEAYMAFIQDPQPFAFWCERDERTGAEPLFRGPIKAGLQAPFSALKNFYNHLVNTRLMEVSPWASLPRPATPPSGRDSRRSMREFWPLISDGLNRLAPSHRNERIALAMHLLVALRIRLSRLVALRLSNLTPDAAEPRVDDPNGMSGTESDGGMFSVHPEVYGLVHRIVGQLVKPSEMVDGSRFVFAGPSGEPILAATLRKEIARFLARCAQRLAENAKPQEVEEFKRLSSWWLRARASERLDLTEAHEAEYEQLMDVQRIFGAR